ncbi:hypothetical protein BB561_005990 [Smittium simulii]|uniref:Myb-like domain-containing protein n=1 Tax=Smittium simulii TaxID=133385 RepID=A0A2T9Y762_9FUNG|nr:hypothetical protein BB561_005990 [Smittium simulii]
MSSEAFNWDENVWETLLDELKNKPVGDLLSSHEADLDSFIKPFAKYNSSIKTKKNSHLQESKHLSAKVSSKTQTLTPEKYKKINRAKFRRDSKRIKSDNIDYLTSDSFTYSPLKSSNKSNALLSIEEYSENDLFKIHKNQSETTKNDYDFTSLQNENITSKNFSKKWTMAENKILLKEVRDLYLNGHDVKNLAFDESSSNFVAEIWNEVSLGLEKAGFIRSAQHCYKRWKSIYKHLGNKIMDYIQNNNVSLSPAESTISHAPLSQAEQLSIINLKGSHFETPASQNDINYNSVNLSKNNPNTLLNSDTQELSLILPESKDKNPYSPSKKHLQNSVCQKKNSSIHNKEIDSACNSNILLSDLEKIFLNNDRFKSKFYCQLVTDVVEAIENPFSKPGMAVKRAKWQHEQNIENMRGSKKKLDNIENSLTSKNLDSNDLINKLNSEYLTEETTNYNILNPLSSKNINITDIVSKNSISSPGIKNSISVDKPIKKRKIDDILHLENFNQQEFKGKYILPNVNSLNNGNIIDDKNIIGSKNSGLNSAKTIKTSVDSTNDIGYLWKNNNNIAEPSIEMDDYYIDFLKSLVAPDSSLNKNFQNSHQDFENSPNLTSNNFLENINLNDKSFDFFKDDDVDKSDEAMSESDANFNENFLDCINQKYISDTTIEPGIETELKDQLSINKKLDRISKPVTSIGNDKAFNTFTTEEIKSIDDLVQKIIATNQLDALSIFNPVSKSNNNINIPTVNNHFNEKYNIFQDQNEKRNHLDNKNILYSDIINNKISLNELKKTEFLKINNSDSNTNKDILNSQKNSELLQECISDLPKHNKIDNNLDQLKDIYENQKVLLNLETPLQHTTLTKSNSSYNDFNSNMTEIITQQLVKKILNSKKMSEENVASSEAYSDYFSRLTQEVTSTFFKGNNLNLSDKESEMYNILKKAYNTEISYKNDQLEHEASNADTDLESLYQEALQAGEEINYKNESQNINESDFLFTEDQMNTLREQQQENLQLVLQSYLIECFQNGPHTDAALHWKNQMINIYNTSNKYSKSHLLNVTVDSRDLQLSFLCIPGINILVPFILYLVADIHCTFQLSEPNDSKNFKTPIESNCNNTELTQSVSSSKTCNTHNDSENSLNNRIYTMAPLGLTDSKDSKKSSTMMIFTNDSLKPEKNTLKSTNPIPIAPLPSNYSTNNISYQYNQNKNYSFFSHFKSLQIPSNSSHPPMIPLELSYNSEFLLSTAIVKKASTKNICNCVSQTMPTHPFLIEHVLPNVYSHFVNKNGYMFKTPENVLMNFYTFETKSACKAIIDQLSLFSNKSKRFQNPRKKQQNTSSLTSNSGDNIEKTVSTDENKLQNIKPSEDIANIMEIIKASAFPKFAQFIMMPIFSNLKWSYKLYPQIQASRRFKNRVSFLPQEDELILQALSFFGFDDTASMSAHLLPCKTPSQISNRIQNLRARRAPANSVKDFCLQRIVPLNLVQEEAIKAGIFIYGKDFKESAVEFLASWPRSVIRRVLDNIYMSISEDA